VEVRDEGRATSDERRTTNDEGAGAGETSARVRERVIEARERQQARLESSGLTGNVEMIPAEVRTHCRDPLLSLCLVPPCSAFTAPPVITIACSHSPARSPISTARPSSAPRMRRRRSSTGPSRWSDPVPS
jgi:hypothetical protein